MDLNYAIKFKKPLVDFSPCVHTNNLIILKIIEISVKEIENEKF